MAEEAYDLVETPIGACCLVVQEGKLVQLSFRGHEPAVVRRNSRRVRPFARALARYFSGGGFPSVPLDLGWATAFQRAVYRVVRGIPRGRVITYGEVAKRAGHPHAARAVGGAMGANRICLAVP